MYCSIFSLTHFWKAFKNLVGCAVSLYIAYSLRAIPSVGPGALRFSVSSLQLFAGLSVVAQVVWLVFAAVAFIYFVINLAKTWSMDN